MKRSLGIVAALVAATVFLSGCSAREPKPIVYPTYPEQESQTAPRYDFESGIDDAPVIYTSETVKPSRKIDNAIIDKDALARNLEESFIFDIKPPVAGQPFVAKVTFKSDKEGYFVGVDKAGSYTEPIGYFSKATESVVILGTYPNKESAGIKFFGTGQWSIELSPISQLPVFDGELKGEGNTAFIVDGDTTKVLIENDGNGGGILVRSYGYSNRIVLTERGGGSRKTDTALPGNGSIIVIEHGGEWSVNKVKEVVEDEE